MDSKFHMETECGIGHNECAEYELNYSTEYHFLSSSSAAQLSFGYFNINPGINLKINMKLMLYFVGESQFRWKLVKGIGIIFKF